MDSNLIPTDRENNTYSGNMPHKEQHKKTLLLRTKIYSNPNNKGLLDSIFEFTRQLVNYSSVTDSDNVEPTCAICLSEICDGDKIAVIPCKHVLHSECLKKWLKWKNQCPLCMKTEVAKCIASPLGKNLKDPDPLYSKIKEKNTTRIKDSNLRIEKNVELVSEGRVRNENIVAIPVNVRRKNMREHKTYSHYESQIETSERVAIASKNWRSYP